MKILTAADIMDRSEMTLTKELAIGTAMRQMLQAGLRSVPVIDEDGRLCGMLTEKDCLASLVRQAVNGEPSASVADSMTSTVESVAPTAQLLDIVQIFLKGPCQKIAVVDSDGRVVGQLSHRDILSVIDSAKDNRFLYGTKGQTPGETGGVHSAMQHALGKS